MSKREREVYPKKGRRQLGIWVRSGTSVVVRLISLCARRRSLSASWRRSVACLIGSILSYPGDAMSSSAVVLVRFGATGAGPREFENVPS